LEKKCSGSGLENRDYSRRDSILYRQKLALTSPTSGCLPVGAVRSLTQATEFVVVVFLRIHQYAILLAMDIQFPTQNPTPSKCNSVLCSSLRLSLRNNFFPTQFSTTDLYPFVILLLRFSRHRNLNYNFIYSFICALMALLCL
jgi:hypothetical protein